MIIGLTGGLGSGKTTVLRTFKDLGAVTLSSDEITRHLMAKEEPLYHEIIKHFGNNILNEDQSLDRSKLRKIIFHSHSEKNWLEALLHPSVKSEILKFSKSIDPRKYLIVEIPLLIEADFFDAVDRVLVIDSDETMQLKRVAIRDKETSLETLQAILDTQVDRETRLKYADDVIKNEGTLDDLSKEVFRMHQFYTSLLK